MVFEMGISKKFVVGVVIIFAAIVLIGFSGLFSVPGINQTVHSGEYTARVGPSGGENNVTELSSPLYGVKVEIPDGALNKEIIVTLVPFSETDMNQRIGNLPEGFRFFGGIKIEGDDVTLMKSINITMPNSLGAAVDYQLLMGQVVDLDKNHSVMVYKGVAHIGSPIEFSVANFGSFAVLSPTIPLGLISGTFVNPSGNPVSNGLIATSFSKPFVAFTNKAGNFEIPAGPAGSYAVVVGIPPTELKLASLSSTGGIGLKGAQLPEILPTPPTSLTDVIVNVVMDVIEIQKPPPMPTPCACDPPPSPPLFSSKEQSKPPFNLHPGENIQTFMFTAGGIYGPMPAMATFPFDLLQYIWSGSMSLSTQVSFSTDDPNIATVNPQIGFLTAKSEGETTLRGEVWVTGIKNCGYAVQACPPYKLTAVPAKVIVGQKGSPPTLVYPGGPDWSPSSPLGWKKMSIDTLTPTFKWNMASDADYYGLYIWNQDTGGSIPAFDSQEKGITITGNEYTLPSGILQYGEHYSWDIAPYSNTAGRGNGSKLFYFQTLLADTSMKGTLSQMQNLCDADCLPLNAGWTCLSVSERFGCLEAKDTLNIGNGWTISTDSISPPEVWLIISKDGIKRDDKVVLEGEIYTYSEKKSGLLLAIYVEGSSKTFYETDSYYQLGYYTETVQLRYMFIGEK